MFGVRSLAAGILAQPGAFLASAWRLPAPRYGNVDPERVLGLRPPATIGGHADDSPLSARPVFGRRIRTVRSRFLGGSCAMGSGRWPLRARGTLAEGWRRIGQHPAVARDA